MCTHPQTRIKNRSNKSILINNYLNVNELNSPTKRCTVAERIKNKTRSNWIFPIRDSFSFKDTCRLKVKE